MLAAAVPREGAATAERLRAAIERDLYPVTVSIGIYEANPGVRDPLPESLWGPVNVAARAMYNTKRPRRNHVVNAADKSAPSPTATPAG
jgi:GGDEF domain-containing protein